MAVNFKAIFSAQDKVSGTLKNIDKAGEKVGNTFKKIGALAAGAFSAVAVVSFGKDTVNTFTTFENKMNEVFTLLPDMSETAMDKLSKQTEALAKKMGRLPTETVPALYQAISAGVPQNNIFDFLERANKAAVGGVATLEDSVGVLSTVINNYGADVIDVSRASDLLFTTVKKGVTTFPELATAIGRVLPMAVNAGVNFEQVSASMATLTATMGKGSTSEAVTALTSLFDELSNSSSNVFKKFKEASGQTFPEFMKAGNSLTDAMAVLDKKAKVDGKTIGDLFSNATSKTAINIFANNIDTLSNNLDEMRGSLGATDKAFEKMEKGFQRKLDKLKSKIEAFKINVGGKLVNGILWGWEKAEPIFNRISNSFNKLKSTFLDTKFAKGFGKIFKGSFKEGSADILSSLGFNDKSIETIFSFAKMVKSAFTDIVKAVNPVINTIKTSFEKLMPTFNKIQNFLAQKVLPIWQEVFSFISNSIVKPFLKQLQENIPKIVSIFNSILDLIQPILQMVLGVVKYIVHIIQPTLANTFKFFSDICSAIYTVLDGLIQYISGVFTGNWQSAWEGVAKIFSGIWNGIGSVFKFIINTITGGINTIIRGLNKIKLPEWVPGIGGKGISIPEIPMLAKGSKFSPDTFIAGEQGPELITNARGSRVFTNNETNRMLNPSFGVNSDNSTKSTEKTININLNGNGKITTNGVSPDEVLEILITHIKPVLMKIIKAEIYEEGAYSYDY